MLCPRLSVSGDARGVSCRFSNGALRTKELVLCARAPVTATHVTRISGYLYASVCAFIVCTCVTRVLPYRSSSRVRGVFGRRGYYCSREYTPPFTRECRCETEARGNMCGLLHTAAGAGEQHRGSVREVNGGEVSHSVHLGGDNWQGRET